MVYERNRVALVGPQTALQSAIIFQLESEYNFDVVVFSQVEMIRGIFETDQDFKVVICENIQEEAIAVYKALSTKKMPIPFFVIGSPSPVPGAENIKMLAREDSLPLLDFELKKIFDKDTGFNGDDFTGISLAPLKHFISLKEDVFIRLVTGRYLQLFSAKDELAIADLEKYEKKGVQRLFIKRQAANWIMKVLEYNNSVIAKSESATIDLLKLEVPSDQLDEVVEQLEEIDSLKDDLEVGVSVGEKIIDEKPNYESPFSFNKKFLQELHNSTKKIIQKIKKNKTLFKMLKEARFSADDQDFFRTRINIVTNIACAIAGQLEWGSDATYEKLIYVSHVHDLCLVNHIHLARCQTIPELELISDLSPEDRELFMNHPQDIAKIISMDHLAPQDADVIIRQHHEKPDRSGFPLQPPAARILPFAIILSISINFAQYIMGDKKWSIEGYLLKARKTFKSAIYYKIFNAIEELAETQAGKK